MLLRPGGLWSIIWKRSAIFNFCLMAAVFDRATLVFWDLVKWIAKLQENSWGQCWISWRFPKPMRRLWLWGSMGLFGDEFSGQRRQPIRQYLNEPCFCAAHIKPLKSLYWEALAGCYCISAFSNSLLSSAGFYCSTYKGLHFRGASVRENSVASVWGTYACWERNVIFCLS